MKSKFKYCLIGIIIGILITASITTYATNLQKLISVYENYINIEVNGKEVDKPSFLYDNTTYVPLRAIAEMLNCNVIWDENTNTANIVTEVNNINSDSIIDNSELAPDETSISKNDNKMQDDTHKKITEIEIFFSTDIIYNNSVGNEWNSYMKHNDKYIFSSYYDNVITISNNKDIVLDAYVYEYDERSSDYGVSTFVIPYTDIIDGNIHTYTKEITVREDGGRYKGNTARINFTLVITPK